MTEGLPGHLRCGLDGRVERSSRAGAAGEHDLGETRRCGRSTPGLAVAGELQWHIGCIVELAVRKTGKP
jgi:hypothetical protein